MSKRTKWFRSKAHSIAQRTFSSEQLHFSRTPHFSQASAVKFHETIWTGQCDERRRKCRKKKKHKKINKNAVTPNLTIFVQQLSGEFAWREQFSSPIFALCLFNAKRVDAYPQLRENSIRWWAKRPNLLSFTRSNYRRNCTEIAVISKLAQHTSRASMTLSLRRNACTARTGQYS